MTFFAGVVIEHVIPDRGPGIYEKSREEAKQNSNKKFMAQGEEESLSINYQSHAGHIPPPSL